MLPSILLGYLVYIDPHKFEVSDYEKFQRWVVSFGGKLSPSIRKDLTCAIFHSVYSENYLLTMQKFSGMMVVSAKWLIDCYRRKELVPLEQYRLSCFTGLVICCTGIDPDKRLKISKLIQDNGGKFSDQLEKDRTTHLICENPNGAKYEAAVKWQIPIVRQNWISDCIKQKQYLSYEKYLLRETKGSMIQIQTGYQQSENDENLHNNISRKRNYDSQFEESSCSRKILKTTSEDRYSTVQSKVEETLSKAVSASLNGIYEEIEFENVKVVDLPSLSGLTATRSDIFRGFRFFVNGFLPEVEAYLVAAILMCGGDISHTIHSGVQFLVAGTNISTRIKMGVKEMVNPSLHVVDGQWLLRNVFENPGLKYN